jgi:polar amino acid transport system substrate-binding protein
MTNCLFKKLITIGLIIGINIQIRVAEAETIKMATIDLCPFACNPVNEGGKQGFMTDVLRFALKNAGYDLQVKILPYVRAVRQTRNGNFDGIVVVGKPYAPDLIYPEIPVVSQRVTFIVKKGTHWEYNGVNSLKAKTIGIVKGYHYVDEELQSYLTSKENAGRVAVLHGESTTERNIAKLLLDRIDIYLEGEFSALYVLRKLDALDKIVFAGYTNNAFDDYVGFSPKSKKAAELASLMTKTLMELKRTGKFKDFLNPYIGNYSLRQND